MIKKRINKYFGGITSTGNVIFPLQHYVYVVLNKLNPFKKRGGPNRIISSHFTNSLIIINSDVRIINSKMENITYVVTDNGSLYIGNSTHWISENCKIEDYSGELKKICDRILKKNDYPGLYSISYDSINDKNIFNLI